mgnify:CR=1 FL=1
MNEFHNRLKNHDINAEKNVSGVIEMAGLARKPIMFAELPDLRTSSVVVDKVEEEGGK